MTHGCIIKTKSIFLHSEHLMKICHLLSIKTEPFGKSQLFQRILNPKEILEILFV